VTPSGTAVIMELLLAGPACRGNNFMIDRVVGGSAW